MKQCTTSNHLTGTIDQLEHILADEDVPAIRAASLVQEDLRRVSPLILMSAGVLSNSDASWRLR
jgi:hypothetical protein